MSTVVTKGATERLGAHVADLQFDAIPGWLIDELKVLTLDYLGVALGGSRTGAARIVADYQREYGAAKEEASIFGRGVKVTAQTAAFSNAVASHSIELDDVDDLALFHFSPPVLSASFAVAEAVGASGRDFLLAAALGSDVMARVSRATNNDLRDRGFHTTPVTGVFGAAAAASKLRGLDAAQTTSAFGIAGAHAGGLMEMYGLSMQKRINPGPAAHNGVVAAGLAQHGYVGAETIFEGERGVLRAFAGRESAEPLVAGLGTEFPVAIEYKAYACARPIHNAVDAALAVRAKVGDRLDAIERLHIRRHPSWAHYHQIPKPRTYHEAQVSCNHGVAVALVEGAAFFDEFGEDRIANPRIARLSQMLTYEADSSLPRGVSVVLEATLAGGEQVSAQVDYPKGSRQNPMTPDERWAKFRAISGAALDEEKKAEVRALVASLENLDAIAKLTALVR